MSSNQPELFICRHKIMLLFFLSFYLLFISELRQTEWGAVVGGADICVFCTCIYVNIPSPWPSGESERCSPARPSGQTNFCKWCAQTCKGQYVCCFSFGFTSFSSPVCVCVCVCVRDRTLTTVKAKAEYQILDFFTFRFSTVQMFFCFPPLHLFSDLVEAPDPSGKVRCPVTGNAWPESQARSRQGFLLLGRPHVQPATQRREKKRAVRKVKINVCCFCGETPDCSRILKVKAKKIHLVPASKRKATRLNRK